MRTAIAVSLLLTCAIAQQYPIAAPQRRTVSPEVAGKLLCGSAEPAQTSASAKTAAPGANAFCGPVPQPLYPAEAKAKGIEGTVLLKALIGTDGTVQELRIIEGHPLLAPAAIEAVKRWKYKPFLVDNKPAEVETTITVNFTLQKGQTQ
jgi:TonB family protein